MLIKIKWSLYLIQPIFIHWTYHVLRIEECLNTIKREYRPTKNKKGLVDSFFDKPEDAQWRNVTKRCLKNGNKSTTL